MTIELLYSAVICHYIKGHKMYIKGQTVNSDEGIYWWVVLYNVNSDPNKYYFGYSRSVTDRTSSNWKTNASICKWI